LNLGHLTAEEVRQRSPRLVLRVQAQELDWNAIVLEPLGQASHHAGLADYALSPIERITRFSGAGIPIAGDSWILFTPFIFGPPDLGSVLPKFGDNAAPYL
jgi:hypothetical protein